MNLNSPTDYRTVFNAMPGASALLLPNQPIFTVIGATDEFAAFAGASKENLFGNTLFTYFPDNPDAPIVSGDIRGSLAKCLTTKCKNELAVQRYDIYQPDGTFREMYWTVIHTPVLDDNGEVAFLIHTAMNVTDRLLADLKDEKIRSMQPAHNLFMQSALAIHILSGPELVITMANEPTLKLWGKNDSVIGKPLREALPELIPQKFDQLANNVRMTQTPYHAHEAPFILLRNGKEETTYLNFVLQPYYEADIPTPTGVIVMASEVTEIYNDRKALEQKERSLELAVEIGELGIFSIDLRSNTVSYSPQIMDWFAVTRLNLPLEELLKKVHEDDYELVYGTLSRLSEEKAARRHDITFRVVNNNTGVIRHLRSIGQIQAEAGEIVTLSGIIQDITVSVASRFAIEQSAQRLKSLIDSAPFPIGVYMGIEMRIEMVNQAILDAWGRDSSIVGKCYSEVLPELAEQGVYQQLEGVFNSGKTFHAHHQRIDLEIDGRLQTYYFNYSFTPLFDGQENVYGIMNTAADVTDLVVAQQALKESERNFRMMILQAPVAMCVLQGPSYIVEIANESMLALWGTSEEKIIGKPVLEELDEAGDKGLEQLLNRVYKTGEPVIANEIPVSLLRKGTPAPGYLNFVAEPYRDGNGIITGILVISLDVTPQVLARHQIEEVVTKRTHELELSNASLQKSNAELEQFAYIASHDLQEPLRKINMFNGMLKDTISDPDSKAQRYMENINSSVNRMTNLVTDILSYSQLSRIHDSFEKIDLNEIFADAIADFDLVIDEKNAQITHSDLPSIEAIPLQMVQLFHNLISNALKYSRPDVPPAIHITSSKMHEDELQQLGLLTDKKYYQIRFSDNGIGFSQLYSDKIFSIFQRLHGRGQYEGTGIGLAMCKKIAENHHGMIYANGREGSGADFFVILPAEKG